MYYLTDFRSLVVLVALPLLLIAKEDCNCSTGTALRSKDILIVPRNGFYCENITRGQTWEDWKTRMVELPKQHVDKPDIDITVDHFVAWPWYLKGMRVTVCNPVGHRPNITWPNIGYSPVKAHCSLEDFPRCPVGLEIFSVQYQRFVVLTDGDICGSLTLNTAHPRELWRPYSPPEKELNKRAKQICTKLECEVGRPPIIRRTQATCRFPIELKFGILM